MQTSNLFKEKKTYLCLISLLFFCFCCGPAADSPFKEEIAAIEYFVKKQMETYAIPSISIAFYKDDFIWIKSYGYADLELRVPATPDTLYRMASLTKPMTATGILNLFEEGKLDLDDEVQTYVPYFPQKKWPVTIRHLLGHLSGISHYRDYDQEGHIKTYYDTEAAIGIFKDWDLDFEPGTKFQYTTYGYNLLGGVIEGASGLSYGDYMTEHVWKPLDMTGTRMDIAEDIIPNRAQGYRFMDGEVKNCEFLDISSRFGGGGTLSSVDDMIRFAKGLDEGSVLSLKTQKMMYESMITTDQKITESGMGWGIDFLSGFWNVWHTGGQAGTSTGILRFPGEKFAVVVVMNIEDQNTLPYMNIVSQIILEVYHIRVQTETENEFLKLHFPWHIGLGYYSRHGKLFSENPEEIAESFRYFNQIDPNSEQAMQVMIDAIYPLTGSVFFKLGTWMAHSLGEKYGLEALDNYRRGGAISFFKAYIDLYRSQEEIPAEYRFRKDLEDTVDRWSDSWKSTWTPETKSFYNIPVADVGNILERLKELYSGRSAYPRYDWHLNGYAQLQRRENRLDEGIEALRLATELFPSVAYLHANLGGFYREKEDIKRAVECYKKALEINPDFRSAKQALEELEKE